MNMVIPSKVLRETESWIAFYHPRPTNKFHVVLMPKHPYTSLMDIPEKDAIIMGEIIGIVQSIVQEFKLDRGGYRFITNGGSNQDVPYLHFHLVADSWC
jgi:diadenosine tetraphosphate (Ap4A) HIT family hydrolase